MLTASAAESRATGTDLSALYVFGGAGAFALILAAGLAWSPRPASAVPSFARQTGQPCATCHNGAFPQLTPFGRQFKLNGYTAGGTRCRDGEAEAAGQRQAQIPISGMVVASFTHTQKDLPDKPQNRDGQPNGLGTNNNVMVQDTSVFLAGQLYCRLGAFIQATYDRPDEAFALDNTDIRYANKAKIGGVDVVYGLDANNNPTVEDPWNTTPAWRIPGGGSVASAFLPGPNVTPQIDNFGAIVAGGGAYAWVNNEFYAFVSAYTPLDKGTLQALGEAPEDAVKFDGAAPYWRLAFEKNWDAYSLMFGTYGMTVNVIPDPTVASDKFTDLGFDTQFQYLSGLHFFTARASYTYEWQKLDGSVALDPSTNGKNFVSELNLSATYSYDATYTVTAGWFDNQGSSNLQTNTSGEVIDIGYLPWSRGGPAFWPWLNTRIGLSFTHFDKINSATTNYDGAGRNAKDDNTTFLYAWTAF